MSNQPQEHQEAYSERREFARIPVSMTAWYRRVSDADVPPKLQEQWAAAGPADNPRDFLDRARLPEAMNKFLLHMDAKLDALLGFVMTEKLSQEFPNTVQVLELSGGGVRIETVESFQQGDILELALMLHHAPVRVAGAMAMVTRGPEPAQASPDQEAGRAIWALDFVRIREQDLEAVVQFVFHEERQRLRERLRDR